MNKLYVIGIGFRPFDRKASEIIYNTSIILTTSNRLYEVFKEYKEFEDVKDNIKVINNIDEIINFISSQIKSQNLKSKSIVLLASGDPMFHGIGRRALKEFGEDMVEMLPDLSSIQIGFSRIKVPWDDAFLISLHGAPDAKKGKNFKIKDISSLITKHNKIAILTDMVNIPTAIGRELLKSSPLTMYICERLGYPDEKVIKGTPEEIVNMEFRDPNIVIILKEGES